MLKVDSRVFDSLEMLIIVAFKLAIYFIAQFHIANLEAYQDMAFADVCQADFLGVILSGNTPHNGGQVSLGPFGEEDLEEKVQTRRRATTLGDGRPDWIIDEEAETTAGDLSMHSGASRSFGALPVFPRPSRPSRSKSAGTIAAEPSPF